MSKFVKGDPRINRKGRPKSFDALRALAQEIAHETAQSGGADVVMNGHKVTVAEAILRTWAQSKNPQLVKSFIEIAFGKVPDNINVDEVLRVIVEYADEIDPTPPAS
jgi:hypothetical protein